MFYSKMLVHPRMRAKLEQKAEYLGFSYSSPFVL